MEFFPSFLKMISSLVIVLGIMALAVYAVKRFWGSGFGSWRSAGLIHVLSTAYLGVKKEVVLIEVEGERLVLGVTPTSISFLARIDKMPSPEASDSQKENQYAR